MTLRIFALFAVSFCSVALHMNEDASPIPRRFQLLKEPVDERSNEILQMRTTTSNHNMTESAWFWRPKGAKRIFVSGWVDFEER